MAGNSKEIEVFCVPWTENTNDCICKKGFFNSSTDSECKYCDYPCEECQDSASNCTNCVGSNRTNDSSCGCDSASGLFDDGKSESCIACVDPCSTCSSLDTCTSCTAGDKRPPCPDSSCSLNEYWDSGDSTCYPCASHCE